MLFGIAVLLILWRYISLMLLTAKEMENPAQRPVVERGPFLDRNGRILAMQTELDSVTVWKPEVIDEDAVIELLSPVLGMGVDEMSRIFAGQSYFAYIKRKVTQTESNKVHELLDAKQLPGIHLQREFDRTYPEETLASHVLGIVDVDNKGLEGLELVFDEVLSPQVTDATTDIVYGNQIFLTLDVNIQYLAEKLARSTQQEQEADSVTILVMEADTGDMLAHASVPDFNPNVYNKSPAEYRKNRPATSAYEPGSVFKIFSIASFLEIGGISQHSVFQCNGYYVHPAISEPIKCLGTHGTVNPSTIIKYSCNAGAAYASENTDAETFHDMLTRFGFGNETALPFPGESNGLLHPVAEWSARSKPTIAFGQEISTSAVQIITAASAFANNGYVIEPHIVKKILTPEGKILEEYRRKPIIDAVSSETAQAMLLMMETATQSGGTATRAAIDGVRVSAKTGTAQIFDVSSGSYSEEAFVASCLAIFPTENPEIIIYVVINHPKAGETYGGRIAAPVVKALGEDLVDYIGIPRVDDTVFSHDGTVSIQELPPLRIDERLTDFTGYSKRQLLPLLENSDVSLLLSGSGWVVRQSPEAGTIIQKGMEIVLELE